MIAWLHAAPRRFLIFFIELYRTWVSPMRLPTCRFEPTCSGYAVEALHRHGAVVGGVLSVWRLLRCGPWCKPGYDPVPERTLWQVLRRRPAPDGQAGAGPPVGRAAEGPPDSDHEDTSISVRGH